MKNNESRPYWERYREYEYRKAEWKADHPEATSKEYEKAMKEIAKELKI